MDRRHSTQHPFPSLLLKLRKREPKSSIESVVDVGTIELLRTLLFREDYANIADVLIHASDIENLLELVLYFLRRHSLSNLGANLDMNCRARRLMSKIISRTPIIPGSLFLTGLTTPSDRNFIGSGGFGVVYKSTFEGSPVALKVLHKTRKNSDFCREALMWRSLCHKFVLPFLGIYEDESATQYFLVSPYMGNGTLAEWRKRAAPSASEVETRLFEVAGGLDYIHSEGVVHGDLCGANVLLDDDFQVKIADFGLTRHSEATVTGSGAKHDNFAAPELFGYSDASESAAARTQETDVYAFGCLYYEIHYNVMPFEGKGYPQIVRAITRGERPRRLCNPLMSDAAWILIYTCWMEDKQQRPTICDVVETMKSWGSPSTLQSTSLTMFQGPESHAALKSIERVRSNESVSTASPTISEVSSRLPSSPHTSSSAGIIRSHASDTGPRRLMPDAGYHSSDSIRAPSASSRNTRTRPVENKSKISVAIDFGTTFSGVAYASVRDTGGEVRQILNWPGSSGNFSKIPTCLLYDKEGRVLAWGLQAKFIDPLPDGATRCELFKLHIEPQSLRHELADPRLPRLPPGMQPIDVIADFLQCLWQYAKHRIATEIRGDISDLDSAEIWLAVPAIWDEKGCNIMQQAATDAGLMHFIKVGNPTWRDRIHIIPEPKAAAVHCAFHADMYSLRPPHHFIVANLGGGTCDLAVYKIIGILADLGIAEVYARSGGNCGSIFVDFNFQELVKNILSHHPIHLDQASLACFVKSFVETSKMLYRGHEDDDALFRFTCFHSKEKDDPSVGLIGGELHIRGSLLRDHVFSPVADQVLNLIEEQMAEIEQPIHALFIVGGFANSMFLRRCIEEKFGQKIGTIVKPPDADAATLRGAALYGLSKGQLISSTVAPRSYMIKVKTRAEEEDEKRRASYITTNNVGAKICQNRVEYLLVKGTVLRKGKRRAVKLCKFSRNAQDSKFLLTIFANESNKVMRYTDEGEMSAVFQWIIDLSTLPAFSQNAIMHESGGFYTEFEIGLELDGTEVRGVLMHQKQAWESVVLDFI